MSEYSGTPEEFAALVGLEESIRVLRRQMENPRAWRHHVIESAQAVETDARWILVVLISGRDFEVRR